MNKREIKTTLALDGEKEFKKGLAEAQREMRVLDSESKAVTAAFNNNRGSVESLTAKNQVLTKQISQQEEIVRALSQAVQDSAASYGEADQKTDGYRIQLNNAQAALNKMEGELSQNDQALKDIASAEERAGNEATEMGNDVKRAGDKTNALKSQVKDFASSSFGQFMTVAGVVALLTSAVGKLWDTFEDSADWGDELLTQSIRAGVAVDTLQELGYAQRFVDTEAADMVKGMARLVAEINKAKIAGNDYIETAGGMRLSIKDSNDALKDSELLFYQAVDAIGAMANETEREAAAQDLFGKSYQDLMPLIKAGSGALKKYADEARKSGIVLNKGYVAVLGKLDDEMERASAVAEAEGLKLSAATYEWGVSMNYVKSTWDNAMPILVEGFTRIGYLIQGMTDAEIDSLEYWQIGAKAAGLETDDFTHRVWLLQNAIYETSNGTITWAQAQDEAYSQVIEGADAASWAVQAMAAHHDASYERIFAAQETYQAKFKEYQDTVKSTAESFIADLGGIFGKFNGEIIESQKDLDKMSETLLENAEGQTDIMSDWADEMDKLAARGIDEGLLKRIRDMGPEAYNEVRALNNMTDEQLQEWVGYYEKMGADANAAAAKAHEDLYKEVQTALANVRTTIANERETMLRLGENLAKGVGDGFADGEDYISRKLTATLRAAIADAASGMGAASTGNATNSISRAASSLQASMEPVGSSYSNYSYSTNRNVTIKMENHFGDYTASKGAAATRDLSRKLGELYN